MRFLEWLTAEPGHLFGLIAFLFAVTIAGLMIISAISQAGCT